MLNGRLDNLLTAGVDRGDVPGVVAIVVSGEGTLYEAPSANEPWAVACP